MLTPEAKDTRIESIWELNNPCHDLLEFVSVLSSASCWRAADVIEDVPCVSSGLYVRIQETQCQLKERSKLYMVIGQILQSCP